MKKKILAIALIGAMAASLAACGGNSSENSSASGTSDSSSSSEASSVSESSSSSSEASSESADSSSAEESDMQYVIDKGTLVVGITNFEPMDYQDADGNWIGFDADLATAFAESLGVEVQFQEIDWNSKILELDGKTIDCVWNGMTLTDEVLNSMETTNAYCNNAQVVIVKSDVADQYQDVESLADLNFAVEAGSAGADAAAENGFSYTEVQNQAAALMEIAAGTSDAAIIDSLMAAAMIGEGTSYEDLTYTVSLTSEEYGVGFRKGSDLAQELNTFFENAYADGTMQSVAETYGVQAALIEQ
ncbi:MAG TPA: transporter substrate-binding domain-containing protein [Candidatus Alectryocaccobium stercorigallinarum]|nr:transporter substrate-binding domain-containing protein [Candidatus Alectryocaccobium stercorigallinarum]